MGPPAPSPRPLRPPVSYVMADPVLYCDDPKWRSWRWGGKELPTPTLNDLDVEVLVVYDVDMVVEEPELVPSWPTSMLRFRLSSGRSIVVSLRASTRVEFVVDEILNCHVRRKSGGLICRDRGLDRCQGLYIISKLEQSGCTCLT